MKKVAWVLFVLLAAGCSALPPSSQVVVAPLPAPKESPSLRAQVEQIRQPSWVCEVEGASRIFTGVGLTAEEAVVAAKNTCGSHLRATFCKQTECRQLL